MSCRAIAKLVGRSPTAVRSYIHDKDGYGTRKSGGRPPKVTPTAVRRLVCAASQTGQSSTKLQRDLELPIKPRRVRQILSGCKHLKYQKRKGQPLLSKEHCKKLVLLRAIDFEQVAATSVSSEWSIVTQDGTVEPWTSDVHVCTFEEVHIQVSFALPRRKKTWHGSGSSSSLSIDVVTQSVAGVEDGVVLARHPVEMEEEADSGSVGFFDENGSSDVHDTREAAAGIRCEFDEEFCRPKVVAIDLPEVKGEEDTLDVNHTLLITFADDTNQPDATSRIAIQQFLVFDEYIGDELRGTWLDPRRLQIRVVAIERDRIKSLRELMTKLVHTRVILSPTESDLEGNAKQRTVTTNARFRLEPTGEVRFRVTVGAERQALALTQSPSLIINACQSVTFVRWPQSDQQTPTKQAGRGVAAFGVPSAAPSSVINGMLSHGGDHGALISHEDIQMEHPGSWSLSMWLFLTEDSTGSFRTLFFHGNGTGQHRTPSAWLRPDDRKLVLRVSTEADMDVGMSSKDEIPMNQWVHLAFTFRNCSTAENASSGVLDAPGCPVTTAAHRSWFYAISFYINGVLDQEVHVYAPALSNRGPLHIAKGPWTNGLSGFTSMTRTFPRPLSVQEHREWYVHDKRSHLNFRHKCDREDSLSLSAATTQQQVAFVVQCMNHEHQTASSMAAAGIDSEAYEHARASLNQCDNNGWDLLLEAAELGDPRALRDVGLAYMHGKLPTDEDCSSVMTVAINNTEAIRYLSDAVRARQYDAAGPLAILQAMGEVAFNDDRFRNLSTALYHSGAVGGDMQSFAVLGHRYSQGDKAPQDADIAAYFFHHAARDAFTSYHAHGKQPLIEMNRLYDGLKEDLSKGQLGDDDELIQFQKMRADKEGDVEAMAAMGDLYYWGARGMPRDHVQAASYFRRAAEAGHTPAQSALAGMLLKGEGGKQDNASAVMWYEKAAAKNATRALNGLGFIYFHGSGGQAQNQTRALALFERAAANEEDGDSIFNAGYCHAFGLGTRANVSRAMEFYTTAARKFGHFDAIYEMGKIWYTGVEDSIQRNPGESITYIKAAADAGDWAKSVREGFDYYLAGDIDRALVHYYEAREHGYSVATSNLAYLYDQVLLKPNDLASEQQALAFMMEAAVMNNDKEVLVRIGDFHFYGWGGLKRDPVAALHWYKRASASGVEAGAYAVGHMHEYGLGVPVNLDRAERYYRRVGVLANGSLDNQFAVKLALLRLKTKRWFASSALRHWWPTADDQEVAETTSSRDPNTIGERLDADQQNHFMLWWHVMGSSSVCAAVLVGWLGFRYIR
ncbi:TPA: hypothetical protein N0F65_008335 [Lagenidium giganteum]|uniref:Uncharacterized protein n=1 Tax=Lagenidium giganteum TaxID=4803 RepID=A0AAV2YNS1_9STRA|nr:TPA: hypothetical protein N0F65_008335 [Lagenidium giganteum]